jgi:hypothetical protein
MQHILYALHCRRKTNIIIKYVIIGEIDQPLDELTSPGAQLNHLHCQFLPAQSHTVVQICNCILLFSTLTYSQCINITSFLSILLLLPFLI